MSWHFDLQSFPFSLGIVPMEEKSRLKQSEILLSITSLEKKKLLLCPHVSFEVALSVDSFLILDPY